ncbi:hypothetical protein [Oerskovia paurometabola]|uniref:hypothetical protein n=1 Tax=Oerskovia paurometabola TaxID=162170 RepID=UPI00380463BC
MSAFLTIEIPGVRHSRVRISRVSNTDQARLAPDMVSTYQVDVPDSRDREGYTVWRTVATINHRYGDGERRLAIAALTALEEHSPRTTEVTGQ